MKILFVCLGNICRSPMAEFIAKDYINKNKLSNINISSAGTANYHEGEFFHKSTEKLLINKQIKYDKNFKSKPINQKMIDEYDFILVMDNSNFDDLISKFGKNQKFEKITNYSLGKYLEVPDPWYTNNFELVYEILSDSIKNFFSSKIKLS